MSRLSYAFMVQSHPKHGFPTFPWRQGSHGAIELPRLHFCTRLLVSDLMGSWDDRDLVDISIPWIYDVDMNYHVDAISMVQRQLMETTWNNRIASHLYIYIYIFFYIQTYDLWLMRDNFMVIEDPYIFSRITVWITPLQTWRSWLRLSSQLVWIQDALV